MNRWEALKALTEQYWKRQYHISFNKATTAKNPNMHAHNANCTGHAHKDNEVEAEPDVG